MLCFVLTNMLVGLKTQLPCTEMCDSHERALKANIVMGAWGGGVSKITVYPAILSISGNAHLSIRRCIMYVNTILCSCTVLKFVPFYHRVTARVQKGGQSIHHPTSLHSDDICGRCSRYVEAFSVVAARGLRTCLKICISTKNTVPGSPIGFPKWSFQGCHRSYSTTV